MRIMDASRSVGRELFEWSLTAALRGSRVPHFVAVHAVEGMEPGLYRWPSLDVPVRAGNLRDELFRVCLDQDLGRDAAFVVIAAVDGGRLDDRGYREAQLDAGIVEGRLHLAAYAQGLGASGMTFLDSEIPALLERAADRPALHLRRRPDLSHPSGRRSRRADPAEGVQARVGLSPFGRGRPGWRTIAATSTRR